MKTTFTILTVFMIIVLMALLGIGYIFICEIIEKKEVKKFIKRTGKDESAGYMYLNEKYYKDHHK